MRKKQILRIEKDGKGMYASGEVPFKTSTCGRHPCYSKDAKFVKNSHAKGYEGACTFSHFFGFSSRTQLKRWVFRKEWRQKLCDMGFVLCVYEVPDHDTIIGETQAVFLKRNAEKKAEYKLSEYIN